MDCTSTLNHRWPTPWQAHHLVTWHLGKVPHEQSWGVLCVSVWPGFISTVTGRVGALHHLALGAGLVVGREERFLVFAETWRETRIGPAPPLGLMALSANVLGFRGKCTCSVITLKTIWLWKFVRILVSCKNNLSALILHYGCELSRQH